MEIPFLSKLSKENNLSKQARGDARDPEDFSLKALVLKAGSYEGWCPYFWLKIEMFEIW